MAGGWTDERDEQWRGHGLSDARDGERWPGGEDRAFRDRDRVFGERDSGAGYNMPRENRREPNPGRGGRPPWQDRDYQGVSPAFSHHRDDGQVGQREYGRTGGMGGAQQFGASEADARYAREMNRGRADWRSDDDDGLEGRAREAGDFFRRTGRKISNWFSEATQDAGEAMGASTYGSHRGRGPKGYKRSDERIEEDAHQRLTDDDWIDASDISISVKDGEVTLNGEVGAREDKRRAERIVEDLSGVHHVQNNLRVKPAAGGGGYGAMGGSTGGSGSFQAGTPSMGGNATNGTTGDKI